MGDIIFVIKTLVVTVALVVVMQIKVGPQTIEQRALAWIHHSVAVEQLQEVAAGAVKAGRKGVAMAASALGIKTSIAREEQTILGLKVKRSEAYYKQQDEELEKISAEALSTSTNAERK